MFNTFYETTTRYLKEEGTIKSIINIDFWDAFYLLCPKILGNLLFALVPQIAVKEDALFYLDHFTVIFVKKNILLKMQSTNVDRQTDREIDK